MFCTECNKKCFCWVQIDLHVVNKDRVNIGFFVDEKNPAKWLRLSDHISKTINWKIYFSFVGRHIFVELNFHFKFLELKRFFDKKFQLKILFCYDFVLICLYTFQKIIRKRKKNLQKKCREFFISQILMESFMIEK